MLIAAEGTWMAECWQVVKENQNESGAEKIGRSADSSWTRD
jgi:hypothetical protein